MIYFILFVSDVWLVQTVNSVTQSVSFVSVVIVNVFALLLFGLQHSIMARPSFKRWLVKVIDPSIERSTYILGTALAIWAMCYLWIPFGDVIWHFETEIAVFMIRSVAIFGWLFLFLATFMINHFELFGLTQSYAPMHGNTAPSVAFKISGFYKIVRHPIQTGVLIGIWAVPLATTSHIVFATGISIYIFVGLHFEEKDLIREFGDVYLNYMQQVKRVIPFIL